MSSVVIVTNTILRFEIKWYILVQNNNGNDNNLYHAFQCKDTDTEWCLSIASIVSHISHIFGLVIWSLLMQDVLKWDHVKKRGEWTAEGHHVTSFHWECLVGFFSMTAVSARERELFLLLCLVSQMDDSEGTVRQIGAFSEGIQNLTVSTRSPRDTLHILFKEFLATVFFFSIQLQSMLKDDEFFKEISNSPNPSVTDEDSTAWGFRGHHAWSCCEWNSVPTLYTRTLTYLSEFQDSTRHISFVPYLSVNQKYYSVLVQTLTLMFTHLHRLLQLNFHFILRVQGNTTASWFLDIGCTRLCTGIFGTITGQKQSFHTNKSMCWCYNVCC